MNSCCYRIALIANVAWVAVASPPIKTHNPSPLFFEPTEKGRNAYNQQKTSMMRREAPPAPGSLTEKVESLTEKVEEAHDTSAAAPGRIAINAQGTQRSQANRKVHRASQVEDSGDTTPSAPPAKTITRRVSAGPDALKKNNEKVPESAVLVEQGSQSESESESQEYRTDVSLTAKGVDEKNRHAQRLSEEDEELYYKLFPEDREVESRDAMSALEVSGKKAFRIKVPVSGGKRLCLTEENHGGKVRAEPCRRGSSRQKWYWMGSKLKNLFSKGRCLGMMRQKHHIAFQTESLLQQAKGKSEAEAKGHHLSMSFQCRDAKAPLSWSVDEQGRLKSLVNSQCMAINESEHNYAMALPCVEEMTK